MRIRLSFLQVGLAISLVVGVIDGSLVADSLCDAQVCDSEICDDVACDGMGCDADGCDAIGCSGACSDCRSSKPCGPMWTATGNALFLFREYDDAGVLGFNTVNPAERFHAEDLNFDMQTGFELSLARRLGDSASVELRYFGVEDWTAGFLGDTTNGDLLQFNTAVPLTVNAGDAITAEYESALHNAEANLYHSCLDHVDFMLGFRYLEWNESGTFGLQNAAVPTDYENTTSNRLYGGQLGVRGWLWRTCRASWETTAKAGVFGNHARQDSALITNVASLSARGHEDDVAFVGEVGLTGAANLSDHISLRGGYRALWLDGVAVGPGQLAATNFVTASGIDHRGEVFLHGAFAGIEIKH